MQSDISSLRGFGAHQGESCFMRSVGVSENYLQEIEQMDAEASEKGGYCRIQGFDRLTDTNALKTYEQQYQSELQKDIFREVLALYRQAVPVRNETIEKNLIMSLMYWRDKYFSPKPGKFVCSGKIGYKEYLFCYLAYLMNIDTLILLPEGDLKIASSYLIMSRVIPTGEPKAFEIPAYQKKANPVRPVTSGGKINTEHPGRRNQRKELSYEELARLAKSVVMLGVYDRSGEFVGSGSGIAISKDGYILTNLHVVNDGQLYAARLEHDDKMYPSYQIVKYHTVFDLAVIQIEKELMPLRIFDGRTELVRGQKVVAIGSPMGMLNSVSDGIISGFRQVDNQDFIQHTAAVSDGSCGGALLNLYGEVIGINTAHVIHGENMNLAVSYKQILPFILGFIK